MDFNIETRKKQLNHLDQLVSSCRDRIESVVDYLGWTKEKVKKEDHLVQCPINGNHTLPVESWQKHLEQCVIQAEGYDGTEPFLSEYPACNAEQTIYIDRNKKIELFTKAMYEKGPIRLAWNGLDPDPRTSDRLFSTYSADERLCLYEHCVANTKAPPPPPEFTTLYEKPSSENKELTVEELMAQERDAKRRRAKYRSVHLNRKNHTEVMKEVIDGQMREYEEWLASKSKSEKRKIDNGDNCERPGSSISRYSNHSSNSTRKHESRRSRERERSKERAKDRHRDSKRTHRQRSPYRDRRDRDSNRKRHPSRNRRRH